MRGGIYLNADVVKVDWDKEIIYLNINSALQEIEYQQEYNFDLRIIPLLGGLDFWTRMDKKTRGL